MRGRRHTTTFLLLLTLVFVSGCSATTEKQTAQVQPQLPPEPYTRAVEALNKADLQNALTYLNLEIKDYPNDSEYIYKAHLMKSIIYHIYYTSDTAVVGQYLMPGLQKAATYSTSNDIDKLKTLKNYGLNLLLNPSNINDSLPSIQYVLANYNDKTKDYTLPLTPSTEVINNAKQDEIIFSFQKTGSPIPQNLQIDNYRYTHSRIAYDLIFVEKSSNGFLQSGTIDYPRLFYYLANGLAQREKDMATVKLLMQKVIEITENDQYNEFRIKSQNGLKDFDQLRINAEKLRSTIQ